jgi:DNA polymerase IV
MRKIIHIDMDAFFAAVEERDNPNLRGKAIAVGGSAERRGVIATASYEARKFGVRSAMSSFRAMQLCPHLILVPGRFEAYREASNSIRSIFAEYTDLIEPLSLDEAYLDVTENHQGMQSATLIAKEIKARIYEETQLTASAGVSYNKFLAKVASDYQKPNGLTVVTPAEADAFIEALKIEQFRGIGTKTAPKLHALGIHTGQDLKALSMSELESIFGRSALYYYEQVRGIDDRPIETHWERKSVGSEKTYAQDLSEVSDMTTALVPLAEELNEWLEAKEQVAKTVTLKVKYANFESITRQKTMLSPIQKTEDILAIAISLFEQTEVATRPVRLLGISLSKLLDVNNPESSDSKKIIDYSDPELPCQLLLNLSIDDE